jgi:hypothetical protein
MRFYDPNTNPPERLDSLELFPKLEEKEGAWRCLQMGLHPSVTTVLSVFREEYLERWYCKQSIETYIKQEVKDPRKAVKEFFEAPSENAQFGTDVHQIVSDYALKVPCSITDPQTLRHAAPLLGWLKNKVKNFIISEETIASESLKTAGTIDLVFEMNDGRKILGDIKVVKFSEKYPPKPGIGYRAQLSAYADMLKTERGLDVGRMSLYLASPFGYDPAPGLKIFRYKECYLQAFKAARVALNYQLFAEVDKLECDSFIQQPPPKL